MLITPSRTPFMLLLVLCSSTLLTAQDLITAAAPGEKVRFSSPARTCQIRMQIFGPSGEPLFDSTWKDGNVLDWPGDAAHPLAGGSYRCVIMVKDLDGQITEKQATLNAQNGRYSIETHGRADGLTVVGPDENPPKITLLAHDGVTGSVVSTSGDLSFRFGDFLSGKDVERMRVSAGGDLFVDGVIHAKSGIMLPDGTILLTAPGSAALEKTPAESPQSNRSVIVGPLAPAAATSTANVKRTPKPDAAPDFQFKVDGTGVHVGTTSAFGLDVAGDVTLASNLNLPATTTYAAGVLRIGGNTFVHAFGAGNVFLGTVAGNFLMTGTFNTGTGFGSLGLNATGSRNTANGYFSLLFNNDTSPASSNDNTAMGYEAMYHNLSGFENTAVGSLALFNSQHAAHNTAVGYKTLYSASAGTPNGDHNTAIGESALMNVTTGYSNIGLGSGAGQNITTGNYNIDIGNLGSSGDTGTTRIGDSSQTHTFISGIRGITPAPDGVVVYIDSNGQLGTAFSSRRYKFDIQDMTDASEGLMHLRPVTFRYLAHGENGPLQYGLIAEEVAELYPEMVTRDKSGQPESVMYQFLAPMLLNEVQKQQRTIDELKADLDALARQVRALQERR